MIVMSEDTAYHPDSPEREIIIAVLHRARLDACPEPEDLPLSDKSRYWQLEALRFWRGVDSEILCGWVGLDVTLARGKILDHQIMLSEYTR